MRTRNDWFGQSKKNASTGSFPWASVIFNKRYVDTSRTIITNGIIKGLAQADHRHTGAHDGFDSSPTAPGRITELLRNVWHDRPFGRATGHYAPNLNPSDSSLQDSQPE
jgi:hypothetical protein